MEHVKDIKIGNKVLEVYKFTCCDRLIGIDHDHLNIVGDEMVQCPECKEYDHTGTEV